MADRTRTQAIKAVLEDLGKLDRTGNVTSPDSTRVQDRFDAAIVELRNDDVIDITDPVAAIPERAFLPLVDFLIQLCAPAFHKDRDNQLMEYAKAKIKAVDRASRTVADTVEARFAARVLRQLRQIDATSAPSTKETASVTERLTAVLADLANRNIIYIGDIEEVETSGAFDALADYVAAEAVTEVKNEAQTGRLGPLSLIKRQDAERRLRRLGAAEPSFQPLVVSYF